jgi:hypothetical protein
MLSALRCSKRGRSSGRTPRRPSARRSRDKLLRGQTIPTDGDANDLIPKFGQLAASIALDQLIDRHISRPNTKALHQRELSVADLNNVTSFTDWLKTPAGKAWKRTQANTRAYGNQGNLGPTGHM